MSVLLYNIIQNNKSVPMLLSILHTAALSITPIIPLLLSVIGEMHLYR